MTIPEIEVHLTKLAWELAKKHGLATEEGQVKLNLKIVGQHRKRVNWSDKIKQSDWVKIFHIDWPDDIERLLRTLESRNNSVLYTEEMVSLGIVSPSPSVQEKVNNLFLRKFLPFHLGKIKDGRVGWKLFNKSPDGFGN